MITTAQSILVKVSNDVGEKIPDFSSVRISYFNEAYRYYLSLYRWSFKRKSATLTITSAANEYSLSSNLTNYSQTDGLYLVQNDNGDIYTPIDYLERKNASGNVYYLTPDKLTIGFPPVLSDTNLTIWYYATQPDVSSETETLFISIPEAHERPIITYLKHIIFDRKRQRNDARNAILDFKEQLEDAIGKDSEEKDSKFPKTFSSDIYTRPKKII